MKKYLFTESQIKHIIDSVIAEGSSTQTDLSEQQEEAKQIKAVQNFLNQRLKLNPPLKIDGITGNGTQTKRAIEKYQTIIGVYPVDGVWGQDTYDKMPVNDKKVFDDYLDAQGDIIDKILGVFK